MLEDRIIIVLRAAKFAVWRRDLHAAEMLFTRAQHLLKTIHGCK